MKKNYIARRRGTSVAAAALSFALVAPFAQPVVAPGSASASFASTKDEAGQPNAKTNGVKYPGVNADGIYQTSVGEPRYTFEPPKKKAGTIESGTTQDDTDSIQGFVLNTRNGNMLVNPDTKNYRPIPMEGVRVYAEWVDKGGYTSPTYTTVTGPDGRYAIKMRPFFDALGGEHKFDADPNAPQKEKIRVWAENPDGETFQQVFSYNDGFLGPLADTIDTQGVSTQWLVGENRVNNVRFYYGEKPQNEVMHKLDQAVENPKKSSGQGGQVQGKAFWEQDHTQGVFTWNLMNTLNKGDVAAEGLKVYGSYLSDYAINKIKNEAPAAIGVDEIPDGVNGRSPDAGWTRDNEAALQNWIKREMAADTEKDPVTGKFGKDRWIAETVMAKVGADNDYTLQFNGTFGTGLALNDGRGTRAGGNPLTRNDGTKVPFPDGSEHVAWDLLGTVAPSPEYGTFSKSNNGNVPEEMPKHVNWDWLFVSTEDVPGFGVQTPWQTNGYLDHWRYNTGDGWNVAKVGEHLNTSFLSLYADYITFDVTPYDTAENWAKPGDVAETDTKGVPTQFVDNLNYEIEWVNADTGKVVDTSPLLKAGPKGELPSFPLDTGREDLFPNGIDKTTTFRADLYPVDIAEGNARGSRIAADSFTVLVGWAPIYEEKKGKAGEPLESGVPTFDNTTTDEVESEKGSDLPSPVAKFELPDTFQEPEGYTIELDETTGEVTLTFPKDAKPGTKFEVPVVAVLEDGTRTVGSAPFEVVVDTNTTVEPKYEDKKVVPGTPEESEPTFKKQDEDGNVTDETVDAPEGSKFSIPEDFEAPEGYTAEVDPETGKVTVDVDKDALDGDSAEEIEVPVKVKYPDGSEDDATAKFELDTDGDGDPDSTDKDDDGDGIPDEEEKDKGSNPKDKGSIPQTPLEPSKPNQNGQFEPEYDDGTGKPGEDVKVDAPEFKDKDGNKTEAPEDTTFKPGENAPDGVTVDPNTGEITVPVSEDAKPGDKITVPVEVTYPDGSKDTVDVTVTVDEPEAKDNESYEPEYKPGNGKPGEDVKVDAPEFKDKDGNKTEAPEGTTFKPDENAPEGVKVDENTGEITVPVSEDAKPGDKITVPVEVTYPDGSTDTVDVTVTVDEPAKTPDWKDATTTPDEAVEIEKDPNSGEFTPGSTVEVTEGPGTAEIDDSGKITVTPSEDAKPGDKIKVVVKDKDGNEIDTVEVEIKEPEAPAGTDAEKFVPEYKDVTGVKVGENGNTKNPFTEKDVPVASTEIKEINGEDPKTAATDWEFEAQPDGVVKATAPTSDEVKKAVDEELPNLAKVEEKKRWGKFVETFEPYAKPKVKVGFEYEDKSTNDATAGFDLLGKDGKSLLDPEGDFDGDGYTNKEEIEKGTNPADKDSKPSEGDDVKDTTPPTVNPIKPGDKTISGTGDRPNEKIIVELPGGKKVETTTDKDGKWTVKVPAGVELKPGDKVIVSDGAGNETNAQVGIDTGKCVATSLGFGLPLLALIPLGLATQMEIPGLSDVVADANAQLQAANTQIQQQLGLFNPEIAAQVDAANQQLAQFGADLGTVAAGIALIAAGILAGTLIYENCSPNGGGSSVKDLELKGSSGKTYAGSSKKDEGKASEKGAEAGSAKKNESGSSKKDDKAGEKAADKK